MSDDGDEVLLILNEYGTGGIINTPEMARTFAELVLRNRSELFKEEDEFARQLPLVVEDRGDIWFVHGSATDERVIGDLRFGRWGILIKKRDAKVLSIGYHLK